MRRLLAALALVGPCAACIPSNVVAPEDRMVVAPPDDVSWIAATRGDLPGYWVSERIEGQLAGVLLEVRYLFLDDGSYTGAALARAHGRPAFQTLSGTWTLEGEELRLDDASPALVEASGDERLRLSGGDGRVVLRREPNP